MANAGQLENNPLAELIREVVANGLSGAVRLSQSQAKAVIYCENGGVIFAASNLRAHRLLDFLKRSQILKDEQIAALAKTADDEVFAFMARENRMKPDALKTIRANHISDILRAVLLWTTGEWQFDSRVRIGADTRVTIDVKRLLLECARHLPAPYLASRFTNHAEILEIAKNNGHQAKLLPSEAFILSRLVGATSLRDLLATSGMTEAETLRAIYGLSLAGLLKRNEWPSIDLPTEGQQSKPPPPTVKTEKENLESLFTRLQEAENYYDVLNIERQASSDQVKDAYHALARKYHPDRFHQSDAETHRQIDSAFAQIARAYETLGDESAREAYNAQITEKPAPTVLPSSKPAQKAVPAAIDANRARAESSFQRGLAAIRNNQPEQAVRFFAEAASIDPRNGRYRAEYGRALTSQPKTRRIAEIELLAAIALEPNNGDYRVMLAELYQALGLRRRAAGEIQKALAADPKNEAARALLASLKK